MVVLLQTHADYALDELADASAVLLDTRGVVAGHTRTSRCSDLRADRRRPSGSDGEVDDGAGHVRQAGSP